MKELMKSLEDKIKEQRACSDLEGMYHSVQKLLQSAHAQHDGSYEAIAYYYLTVYHYLKKEHAQAIRDCLQGIALCDQSTCDSAYILLSNFAGVLYSEQTSLLSGLQHFLNAYYRSLEHPELHLHHMVLNNLGTLFIKVEDFVNALKYLKEGYEERRKNNIPMDLSDAVIITNITIAYAQLGQFDEIVPWQKIFEENREAMGVPELYLNYQLTLIYMDHYHRDTGALHRHVNELLSIVETAHDATSNVQLISFLFDICLKNRDRDLCERVYEKMEALVTHMDNMLLCAHVSNQYIRMLSEFQDDRLKDALVDNYHLNLQAKEEEQKKERQSLVLKMELEESLYRQRKIMEQNKQLQHTNELDGFTGIYHKKAFQEHAVERIKKVNQHSWGALLILDIDHFKEVNDTYGHLAGDEAILRIVDIMKKVLQAKDICGRIGGDEFSIFICGLVQEEQVQKIMQTILKQVREIRLPALDMTLTMSIGCCLIQKPCSFTEIYQHSDQALYKAKEKGRNQAYLYREQASEQEN